MFSVNPMAAISAKVEMMEVGMATAAISVVRMFARKDEDDDGGEKCCLRSRCCLIEFTDALMNTD